MVIVVPKKELRNYSVIKIGAFLLLLAFLVLLAYVFVSLLNITSPQKHIFSIVLGLIVFSLFVAESDYFQGDLNKNYFKFEKDCIKWKSENFDTFIGKELLELYQDGCDLFTDSWKFKTMSDYSFMLLPIAKVYEGVLKEVLVRIGLTKSADWESNPGLSVSKYFNPVGNEKIFETLQDKARDKTVPHVIYSTYQDCRNKIFHQDSFRDNRIKTVEEADFYRKRIEDAIEKAYETFIKK